jgi:phospholipase/carboxylesterase
MMHSVHVMTGGLKVTEAKKALIMIHGRGASAEDILSLEPELKVKNFAILAPQATNHSWYPYSFLSPPEKNEPWLSSALELIKGMVSGLNQDGISSENIYFLGFSQGACLMLEFAARNADHYGGMVAFTGGLIGDKIYNENYKGDFKQTPVFIGCSDRDFHIPVERVYATTNILKSMHADVHEKIYPAMGHTINADEIDQANRFIFFG